MPDTFTALRGSRDAGPHFRFSSLPGVDPRARSGHVLPQGGVRVLSECHGKSASRRSLLLHAPLGSAASLATRSSPPPTPTPISSTRWRKMHENTTRSSPTMEHPPTSRRSPKSGIPLKVFGKVSLRHAFMGIKANCAWSSLLVGKAPMV